MPKKILGNTLLLGLFLVLIGLPLVTFLTLKMSSPPSSHVLSATSGDYRGYLSLGRTYQPVILQEVKATAFSGQKAKFADIFQVTNSTSDSQSFRITVISGPTFSEVTSNWKFNNGLPEITLNPEEASSISLEVSSTNPAAMLQLNYLVAVEQT